MKKTYIEPKNTIVRLNVERIMCLSEVSSDAQKYVPEERPSEANQGDGLARRTISAPDAWDEW